MRITRTHSLGGELIVRMWSNKCRHLANVFTLFALCLITAYFPVFANY